MCINLLLSTSRLVYRLLNSPQGHQRVTRDAKYSPQIIIKCVLIFYFLLLDSFIDTLIFPEFKELESHHKGDLRESPQRASESCRKGIKASPLGASTIHHKGPQRVTTISVRDHRGSQRVSQS